MLLPSSRCRPKFQLCTYPSFRLCSNPLRESVGCGEKGYVGDAGFVQGYLAPQVGAMVASVADFHHHALAELALQTEIPALHVPEFQIGLEPNLKLGYVQ